MMTFKQLAENKRLKNLIKAPPDLASPVTFAKPCVDGYYRTVRSYPKTCRLADEVVVTSSPDQEGSILSPTRALPNQENDKTGASSANKGTSAVGSDGKKKLCIWPEWNDADVNAEKWDVSHKTKEKEKGKSPVAQNFFEDPEGKVELPSTFKVSHWKRPQEFIDKTPLVVVDPKSTAAFDLMINNEVVHESELMRWITSQVVALWKSSAVKNPTTETGRPITPTDPTVPHDAMYTYMWRPWEHIYAINKISRGPNMPAYNAHGKYIVKLYCMGAWRKITVDDSMPFDENDRLLLPVTGNRSELWPMLLIKALLKVAALDYTGGNHNCEFGDFNVIHCLTSWLPEVIHIQHGHQAEIWNLLKNTVLEFKLPDLDEKPEKEVKSGKRGARRKNAGRKRNADKKDDKKDKKGLEKDPKREKTLAPEELTVPEHPEFIAFASYSGPPKYPVRISLLSDMADASERLRQTGFSHMYPHPVHIKQTRSCPLEHPPKPDVIPAWKLIRPRKKKVLPTDEPVPEPEPEKPIQSVQITSPFVHYKVSQFPVPFQTHRPKSALERSQTRVSSRPGTANEANIEETNESMADSEQVTEDSVTVAGVTLMSSEQPSHQQAALDDLKEITERLSAKDKGAKKVSAKMKGEKEIVEKEKKSLKRELTAPGSSGRARTGEGKSKNTSIMEAKVANASLLDSRLSVSLNTDSHHDAESTEDMKGQVATNMKSDDKWLDFDNFIKCFKTLIIYHKSHTYQYNHKYGEIKGVVDDKAQNFMFIDNLKPTEVVVSFSVLSYWHEGVSSLKDESRINIRQKDRDSRADTFLDASVTVDVDTTIREPLQAGVLIVEPYSWKSLVTGQPIMRLRTTFNRTAVLSLPAGRHVLRFNMTAPIASHLHLCSTSNFVYGDEEKVMAELTKESCRFNDNASRVISLIGKCINNFHDGPAFAAAWDELYSAHCPYRNEKLPSKRHHYKLFYDALYATLKRVLAEHAIPQVQLAFAFRALLYDCTTPNILNVQFMTSRPSSSARHSTLLWKLGATALSSLEKGSVKKAFGKKGHLPPSAEPIDVAPEPKAREPPTIEEQIAAIKLQKCWRGAWVRKVRDARVPGCPANLSTQGILQKAWATVEAATEANGLALFRNMFKVDPKVMPKFPFYEDEWNKISYCDYLGNYPEQAPNQWFLVFREIFFVPEEMLCVPKLYTPICTCTLRVVNNDTGEELPKVFQKVAPYIYKPNKRGYTFVAEAHTGDYTLAAGKWRMRLIGALTQLPTPARNEVNASFYCREIRDYYVPNDKNVLFRYTVKVTDDSHLATIQMSTSKSDVFIKLAILDRDVEVISVTGKAHAVLPAFLFIRDGGGEEVEDVRRSSSRSSIKGAKFSQASGGQQAGSKVKHSSSGLQDTARAASRNSVRQSITSTDEEGTGKRHKYVIQATILRNSWPLSETQWVFVQALKELEKSELKVASREDLTITPMKEKTPSATFTKGKDKGAKKAAPSKEKEKERGSRPPSIQFDQAKPNWLLRVISDASAAENIEVKKDTERQDEILAMKKAWEDAEPGRAAKAQQSRQQYLNSHTFKVDDDVEETEKAESDLPTTTQDVFSVSVTADNMADTEEGGPLMLENPNPPIQKHVLRDIDLTPFIRRCGDGTPRYLDEAQLALQAEAREQELRSYRAYREQVEQRREQDRLDRNLAKVKQLELFQNLQLALDAARAEVNEPREAFRQRYLEAERVRLEAIAEQEARLQAEMDKASPKGKKSARGKKTEGKKKK